MSQEFSEQQLLELADSMAAAATVFSGHGYDTFIRAREEFKQVLHETIEKKRKKIAELA